MRRALLLGQLVVLAILATIHIAALGNDLYWILPWLDLVTHFLGGVWSALFIFWLGVVFHRPPNVFLVASFVLVLGVAWEIFEYSVGISAAADYALDTLSDLCMDLLGAVVVSLAARLLFTHVRP